VTLGVKERVDLLVFMVALGGRAPFLNGKKKLNILERNIFAQSD
jgi:hypothetical protein